jgi:hypothetical protein
MSRTVTIPWCTLPAFEVRRLVLGDGFPERSALVSVAIDHCLPYTNHVDAGAPRPGDLWVACGPAAGWGDCAGDCGWARAVEAPGVLARLRAADNGRCHADDDGDCVWSGCPQLRDDEPRRSGRHCPRDLPEHSEDL